MKKILWIVFLLFVSSCGFHLRGHGDSYQLKHHQWKIVNAGELTVYLKRELLRQKNIQLTDQDQNTAIINIESFRVDRIAENINRYGNVDDYLYSLDLSVQVYFKGEPWGEPNQFHIEKYLSHKSETLAKREEEKIIMADMYREAADRIVRHLYFLPDLNLNSN